MGGFVQPQGKRGPWQLGTELQLVPETLHVRVAGRRGARSRAHLSHSLSRIVLVRMPQLEKSEVTIWLHLRRLRGGAWRTIFQILQ